MLPSDLLTEYRVARLLSADMAPAGEATAEVRQCSERLSPCTAGAHYSYSSGAYARFSTTYECGKRPGVPPCPTRAI